MFITFNGTSFDCRRSSARIVGIYITLSRPNAAGRTFYLVF